MAIGISLTHTALRRSGLLALVALAGLYLWLYPVGALLSAVALMAGLALLYGAARLWLGDTAPALLTTTAAILCLSLLPGTTMPGATGLLVVVAVFLVWAKRKKIPALWAEERARLTLLGPWAWLLLAWLLGILLSHALWAPDGLWVRDYFHPAYELGLGRSLGYSLLSPPDLSYAGKAAHFHFLSTRLPIWLATVLPIDVLTAAHWLQQLLYLPLYLLGLASLLHLLPEQYRPPFPFVLLFGPVWLSALLPEPLGFRHLLFDGSYSLGGLLVLYALLFVWQARWAWLTIAVVLLAAAKASFFLPVFAGLGLWALLSRNIRLVGWLAVAALGFVSIYLLWLQGAHGQNLWVWLLPFRYDAWPQGWWWLPGLWQLALALMLLWAYRRLDMLQPLALMAAIALLATLPLQEYSEGNHWQMAYGVGLPTVLCLWVVWQHRLGPTAGRLFAIAVMLNMVLSFAFNLREPAIALARYGGWTEVKVPGKQALARLSIGHQHTPDMPMGLHKTLLWMEQNLPADAVVLHGRHHELRHWPDPPYHLESPVRSALSGRQFYCEGLKAKGVVMEADYHLRLAFGLAFFRHQVYTPDSLHRQLLRFYAPAPADTLPLSDNVGEYGGVTNVSLHRHSLGHEWWWMNRRGQVWSRVISIWHQKLKTTGWEVRWLKQQGITHLLLENGEQPKPSLLRMGKVVYRAEGYSIIAF